MELGLLSATCRQADLPPGTQNCRAALQQAKWYGSSREEVQCWSGGGPMWIAQDSDIK